MDYAHGQDIHEWREPDSETAEEVSTGRGCEVYVNKVGGAVILFPKENPWAPFFESLSRFSDDFMMEREQPPAEQREF